MKKTTRVLLSLLIIVSVFAGCGNDNIADNIASSSVSEKTTIISTEQSSINSTTKKSTTVKKSTTKKKITKFSLSSVPKFSGKSYVKINGNKPYFTNSDYTKKVFEKYSSLDSLGRCGVAYANVCKQTMPTKERGAIGMIKPTGWYTVKYDCVDGKYLYNRCHLIGYQLTAENANEKNLITGTRYLNVEGMLPFENMVADYVKETNNHVLYRVTPVFKGNNLVASGVLIEAKSVEDKGNGICFNVYCYNNEPNIKINYATGESSLANGKQGTTSSKKAKKNTTAKSYSSASSGTYILNTNSKKFHKTNCDSASKISKKNREVYKGKRSAIISKGYSPCKKCNP